jgi:hypothetical protein
LEVTPPGPKARILPKAKAKLRVRRKEKEENLSSHGQSSRRKKTAKKLLLLRPMKPIRRGCLGSLCSPIIPSPDFRWWARMLLA